MRAPTDVTALVELERSFRCLADAGRSAALVVRRGDQVLLDLSCGADDVGRPFTSTTSVFLYSAVKPVAALAVLLAVADGALGLDARVARLWPAFGSHGKGDITVRQALAHGAAVPGWREPLDLATFADVATAADLLAASPPWWSPGEPGEHATSYGHLLDAILRHGTGRDIGDWWQEVADSGVGVKLRPGSGSDRPWPLRDDDGAWRERWSSTPGVMGALLRNPGELLDTEVINARAGRELVAPAVTGYGSAHDLAHLWSWWTGGEGATRLGVALQRASLSAVLTGWDHVLQRDVAWGLGPQIDDGDVGMGGVGGTFGSHLTRPGLSVGFTTADLSPPGHADVLDDAIDRLAICDGR